MYAEGNVRRARESLWAMRRDRPQIASKRRIDLESVVACEQVAGGQGLARKRDGLRPGNIRPPVVDKIPGLGQRRTSVNIYSGCNKKRLVNAQGIVT